MLIWLLLTALDTPVVLTLVRQPNTKDPLVIQRYFADVRDNFARQRHFAKAKDSSSVIQTDFATAKDSSAFRETLVTLENS